MQQPFDGVAMLFAQTVQQQWHIAPHMAAGAQEQRQHMHAGAAGIGQLAAAASMSGDMNSR